MLIELDCDKTAAFLGPLIEKAAGSASVRTQLEAFAADNGLQI